MASPFILALDGHDASGKTTLARKLAAELGCVYARPFSGGLGAQFLAAAENGRPEEAIKIASRAIDGVMQSHARAPAIVFDRLWITVLSVMPDVLFPQWRMRPPTLLCWADLDTTLARLENRNEPPQSLGWHNFYLSRYLELAARFDCPIVRTDLVSEREASRRVLEWARSQVGGAELARDVRHSQTRTGR